jgi:hypothetical protein
MDKHKKYGLQEQVVGKIRWGAINFTWEWVSSYRWRTGIALFGCKLERKILSGRSTRSGNEKTESWSKPSSALIFAFLHQEEEKARKRFPDPSSRFQIKMPITEFSFTVWPLSAATFFLIPQVMKRFLVPLTHF